MLYHFQALEHFPEVFDHITVQDFMHAYALGKNLVFDSTCIYSLLFLEFMLILILKKRAYKCKFQFVSESLRRPTFSFSCISNLTVSLFCGILECSFFLIELIYLHVKQKVNRNKGVHGIIFFSSYGYC